MAVRDPDNLVRRAVEAAPAFRSAQPFPHAVIDGLFDDGALARVVECFPSPERVPWYKYDNALERKLALPHVDELAPEIQAVFRELQSPAFIAFVESLTGITGLVPDLDLVGAGLHQIERGGSLAVHVDSNFHPHTGLDRRLNVLVYLNQDWPESYGGHLELWDDGMTHVVRRILPVFNRTVVFACSDRANHGHPEPLACPAGRSRKSLAVYFYTHGRPGSERAPAHSTIYKRRPEDPEDPAMDTLRAQRALGRLEDKTTADALR